MVNHLLSIHQISRLNFVDINPDTMNINTEEVEKSINNDKAILAVNLLGNLIMMLSDY